MHAKKVLLNNKIIFSVIYLINNFNYLKKVEYMRRYYGGNVAVLKNNNKNKNIVGSRFKPTYLRQGKWKIEYINICKISNYGDSVLC